MRKRIVLDDFIDNTRKKRQGIGLVEKFLNKGLHVVKRQSLTQRRIR